MAANTTQLAYLCSRTQVDLDTLDEDAGKRLGPLADLTSNQWESYVELCKPKHQGLIKKAIELANKHQFRYPELTTEELAVEICMIKLSFINAQYVTGRLHIMANPLHASSTEKVVETGKRFYQLAQILDPTFDTGRIVMKVPSTWEGLQACKILTGLGIKTLATTLFTFAQAVLAGEAGCTSISPFVHDLRLHVEGIVQDPDPVFDLVVQAQQYFHTHHIPTAVKACAVFTGAEALRLAGADAFTLPGETLDELAAMKFDMAMPPIHSMFDEPFSRATSRELLSYVNDEAGFRAAMGAEGRGIEKTDEAIAIFSDFQKKAESLMTSL